LAEFEALVDLIRITSKVNRQRLDDLGAIFGYRPLI
jgi:hypothetical protein